VKAADHADQTTWPRGFGGWRTGVSLPKQVGEGERMNLWWCDGALAAWTKRQTNRREERKTVRINEKAFHRNHRGREAAVQGIETISTPRKPMYSTVF
jgi:hypothetical protein